MSALRAVVLVWFLAMAVVGQVKPNCFAENCIQINATVRQYVVLPCPCSKETVVVVWQINKIIVNYNGTDAVEETKESKIYKNRTQLVINLKEKSCALGLTALQSDNFTCYVYAYNDQKKVQFLENPFHVKLNVFEEANSPQNSTFQSESQQHNAFTGETKTNGPNGKPQTELSVGVSLSLILVILVIFIMVLLIRKHRRNTPQMGVIKDQQAMMPMMTKVAV